MGLVILDLSFRVEKKFKIRLPQRWFDELGLGREKGWEDKSLADFHAFILRLCAEQSVGPPAESWHFLIAAVAEAAGIDHRYITEDTMIIRDIAPHG